MAEIMTRPSAATLAALIDHSDVLNIFQQLLSSTGTQAEMTVQYVRDVSSMLCLISSVRENFIERHLAVERVLIPRCVAFAHPNYSRYLSYEHVRLLNLKKMRKKFGMICTTTDLVGQQLVNSTIHGDLIIETTINREVKVRGGPMQGCKGGGYHQREGSRYLLLSCVSN